MANRSSKKPPKSIPISADDPSSHPGEQPASGCKEANCFVTFLKIVGWMGDVRGFTGTSTPIGSDGAPVAGAPIRQIPNFQSTRNIEKGVLRERFHVGSALHEQTDCGDACYCDVPVGTEPRSIGAQELEVSVWGIGEAHYRIDLQNSDPNLITATKQRINANGFFDAGAGRHISPNEIGQATTITSYCSAFGCYLLVPYRFLLEGKLTAKFDVLMLNGECKPIPALIADSGESLLVTTHQL